MILKDDRVSVLFSATAVGESYWKKVTSLAVFTTFCRAKVCTVSIELRNATVNKMLTSRLIHSRII